MGGGGVEYIIVCVGGGGVEYIIGRPKCHYRMPSAILILIIRFYHFIIDIIYNITDLVCFSVCIDNPAPAGTTMTGQTYNVKCSVDQLPTELRVDVIGEKRYNDFPALIDTNIQVTFTYTGGEEKSVCIFIVYFYYGVLLGAIVLLYYRT